MRGAIIALWLPPDLASLLASVAREALGEAAEAAEQLHLTLAYLGDAAALGDAGEAAAREALQVIIARGFGAGGVDARIGGVGRFTPDEEGRTAVYVSVDSTVLAELRTELVRELARAGLSLNVEHGFTPHITLGYIGADAPTPELPLIEIPLLFTAITLAWGDTRVAVPFPPPAGLDELRPAPYGAVKAALGSAGTWELDVLGVPFGGPRAGKDTHGEFFSPRTRLHEDRFGLPPAVYYHGCDPDGRPSGTPEYIGRTVKRWRDAAGTWFKVVLDQANTYARRVWEAAQKRQARASSGSALQLVRYGQDGEILEWPVVELSLFDVDPSVGRVPANTYAVAVPAIKSVYQRAGMALPQGVIDVDEEQLKQQIADAVSAALKQQDEARAQQAQAAQQEQARVDAAVKAERQKWEQEAAAGRRLPSGTGQAPHVRQFADLDRFDGLTLEDQVFLIGITNSQPGRRASEAAYKAAYIKAAEAERGNSRAAGQMRAAAKAAGFDLADAASATKAANELMHSTQQNYGDEWVGLGYSTRLWEVVRDPTRIAGMIPEIIIPQGSEGVYDPLEGTDPIFYKVPETTDTNGTTGRPDATIPASKAGSARVLHTATKIGGRIIYSGEMEENALIPLASQLRTKLETAGDEALEHVILDGDTATAATTNINDIANASTQSATNLWLSFDGFRKLALVTNTANSRDAGTLGEDDFVETFRLMGLAGLYGADVKKAIAVIDANTRWKILTLAAVKTRDVFLNATIENGELTAIYGYRIYTSYQMHQASAKRMANANGKVHGTDSNNTTGSIVGVRPDMWKLARKRRVTIETSRWPEADANQIVLTMSVGLKPRDNEAAAISYNITL